MTVRENPSAVCVCVWSVCGALSLFLKSTILCATLCTWCYNPPSTYVPSVSLNGLNVYTVYKSTICIVKK